MIKASLPQDEEARMCAVYALGILNTPPDKRFDEITSKAISMFSVPISTISIIDKDREWYKSKVGITEDQGPRDISFCGHALLQEEIMIIEDTLLDPVFSDNPYVVNSPHIRFYAGKSLRKLSSREPVGVFCIKDLKPRKMTAKDVADFLSLADEAERLINEI